METSSGRSRETRGATFAAWTVILAVIAIVVWHVATTSDPAQTVAAAERRARSLVGTHELLGVKGLGAVATTIDALDRGAPALRQRAAVLAGELIGTADAHRRLARIDTEAHAAGGDVAELQRVLITLYPDPVPAGETQALRVALLDAADRDRVAAMGWSGRLALAPEGMPDPAPRAALLASERLAALGTMTVGIALFLGLIAGCVALLVLIVLFATKRLRFGHEVEPGSQSFGAETFAIWIVLHVGLAIVAREVGGDAPVWIWLIAIDAISPVALFWPKFRGLPWSETRRRIGLYRGGGVVREMACGAVGWLAALPVIAVGTAASYFLMRRAGGGELVPGVGSHPANMWIASASTAEFVVLFVLACVITPIVEETMFRGVLHRHLRERTSGMPRLPSVVLSTALVSVLFAAVHPQGWTGIPVLAAEATTFALVREWRGSLIASMTMHGMMNAAVFLAARLAAAN